MTMTHEPFQPTSTDLGDGCSLQHGRLPAVQVPDEAFFQILWDMHPPEPISILIHGRWVKIPRWSRAYGADYHYAGQKDEAGPVPPMLAPYLKLVQDNIETRTNGILANWYDGKLKHYIGVHRDSTDDMIVGTPIVTISFGEERTWRLRPWKGKGWKDFQATHGSVFVLPYDTNLKWTHEVPHSVRHRGRRISLTFRSFEKGAVKSAG